MTIISRPYASANDLQALIHFLQAQWARNPVQRWHAGDLVWRMFFSSLFDPSQNVRLWHDENGALVGFGWFYPPNGADLHPREPALLPEMIDWAQAVAGDGELYLATLDVSHTENAILEAHGFQRAEPYGYHSRRSLAGAVSAPTLPHGFTLRPLAGDHEVAERALLHQQAFGTEYVTVPGYRNVTLAPLYLRDLDLVAVAPDGRLTAFALCWLDEANRVGLVEPVGTHPDFQRKGLARALLLAGLRQMQARGMQSVVIASAADHVASNTLYRSLGFEPISRELVYVRVSP